MKFEVDAREFENALRNIKAYTSTDSATPVLHNIRIRFTPNDVVVDATDRYAVAQYRTPRQDVDGGSGSFMIHKSALDVLLPALKSRKITVDVVATEVVAVAGVSVPLAEGDFPAIDRLWPDRLPEPSDPFALRPSVMKRLGQYRPLDRRDDAPFQVFAGEAGTPIVVLRGERFRVLAVSLSEGTSLMGRSGGCYEGWRDVCPN